ncbi:MAG: iron-containing alcohol dehydrogenase [Candidatus Lokiarchaeota archaeon]|nr:iron-containing alcohol dehydrogenase [Candidatus Lokiarchaeota archaeon]
MSLSFNFARIPHIIFGSGKLANLYSLISQYGNSVLIVVGASSLKKSGKLGEIEKTLGDNNIIYNVIDVKGEPSPSLVDEAAQKYRNSSIDVVVGIGGGSVTDAGKAISAMILKEDSIKNYLEGVGNKIHNGQKIPYIAIPTTSGTGSEATKNAVISEIGNEGYKKSLRHDNLIPDVAIIDPELMKSCPASVTAACGMDAFTQLLESYISSNSNPITDALAYSGMKYMKDALIPACSNKSSDINTRSSMAYGSLISGMTLANAGLGVVHGLASPIGARFRIPHGVVCGTILAEATKMNIKKLKNSSEGMKSLKKYADIGALLSNKPFNTGKSLDENLSNLIKILYNWTEVLNLDKLSNYGISHNDISKIVEKSGLKNNPVNLDKKDMTEILENRL